MNASLLEHYRGGKYEGGDKKNYPIGKIVNSFAMGLGIKLNNEAQWMVLYHDLELISNLNILKLMVVWRF